LRVLHVWNTAGVASVIAKYQRKLLGWDTWVLMRREWDKFGLTTYGEVLDVSAKRFILKVLLMARKYDVIHVHFLDRIVPLLKLLYPWKTIILHYHGEIRGRWSERRKYWRWADILLVSTPDLLEGAPDHAIYLPNPVDTELFKPMPKLRRPGTGLFIVKWGRMHAWSYLKDIVYKYCRELSIECEVLFADKNPVKHTEMPYLLNKYEYFIDIPHGSQEHGRLLQVLSKTGLEALACGLKVVRWDGRVVERLPPEHRPESVVYKLKEIIEEKMR